MDIAVKLVYTDKETIKGLESDLEEISSMMVGLGRNLRKRV